MTPIFWWMRVLLVCAATIFLIRGPVRAVEGSHDLTGPYAAARVWLGGGNPYDGRETLAALQEGSNGRRRDVSLSVYPPSTIAIMAPLGRLSWPEAVAVWLGFQIAIYALGVVALVQWAGLRGMAAAWLVLVCLIFAPAHTGLALGQPGVSAAMLGVIGMHASLRGRWIIGAAMLGLGAALKPQVGGIFPAYLGFIAFHSLIGKQPERVLSPRSVMFAAIGAAVVMFGFLAIGIRRLEASGVEWWPAWKGNLQSVAEPTAEVLWGELHLDVLTHGAFRASPRMETAAIFFLGLLGTAWLWFLRRGGGRDPLLEMGAGLPLTLLAVYHRPYDTVILLVIAAWAIRTLSQSPDFAAPREVDPADNQSSGSDSAPAPYERLPAVVSLFLLAVFIVPGAAALLSFRSVGWLPAWLTGGWWWEKIVLPHAVWSVVALTCLLLVTMARHRWIKGHRVIRG